MTWTPAVGLDTLPELPPKRRNRRVLEENHGRGGSGAPRMSYTARHPALASRRRRWPLVLIFAVVVLATAAWTGLWFYAAAKAKTEIAAWRAREFDAGRFYDCATDSIGGFPFRIEWRCATARLEFNSKPMLELKLPVIAAAVQVYDPRLLIS